jgi:hypothetical protein
LPITTNAQNLGLYGGVNFDLTYSNLSSRIFAAFQSPISLYQSDDSGATWYKSFPIDSLVFECKTRGWGGRAIKVFSNDSGWIAVRTSMKKLSLTSVVVNFENGDTGKWETAVDPYLLQSFGYNPYSVSGFGMNNYILKCLLGPVMVNIKEATLDPANDIIDFTNIIPDVNTSYNGISIAIANNTLNEPFYLLFDTNNTSAIGNELYQRGQLLYKFDGINYNLLSVPNTIQANLGHVFLSPGSITGDTVFITGMDSNNTARAFRSFDGGQNWSDISYNGSGTANEISDVDYSPDWISFLPQSNGIVLIAKGKNISYDLGNSWSDLNDTSDGEAVINPVDINFMSKMGIRGMLNSYNGSSGLFISAVNRYLNSFEVFDNVHSLYKNEFYVSTSYGLIYTNAYLNNSLSEYEKWNSPYGISPVDIGNDSIITAMAMNPYDSLNVIVGFDGGISTTLSGVNGFTSVTVGGFVDSIAVKDIEFVDSLTVIAITGRNESDTTEDGRIWKSIDKGVNWSNISPSGFTYGTALAVGKDKNDTSIYVASGRKDPIASALWRSVDKGINWIKVNEAPGSTVKPILAHLPIFDIAVDPRSTDTIYMIAAYVDVLEIVRSTDGGTTFSYLPVQDYQDEFDGSESTILIYDTIPDLVLFTFSRNIIFYYQPKDTIGVVFTGLMDEFINHISYGSILAGTTTGFYILGFDPVIESIIIKVDNLDYRDNILVYPIPIKAGGELHIDNVYINQQHINLEVYNSIGQCFFKSEKVMNGASISLMIDEINIKQNGLFFIRLNDHLFPIIVSE